MCYIERPPFETQFAQSGLPPNRRPAATNPIRPELPPPKAALGTGHEQATEARVGGLMGTARGRPGPPWAVRPALAVLRGRPLGREAGLPTAPPALRCRARERFFARAPATPLLWARPLGGPWVCVHPWAELLWGPQRFRATALLLTRAASVELDADLPPSVLLLGP